MMTNLLTLAAMFVFLVAASASAYRWGRPDRDTQETFERSFLVGLGRGLGLDRYTEREYFGEQVQVLAGQFHELDVELEVASGREWTPYLRVTIDFPESLAQDFSIYSGSRRPLGSSVRGMDECEFGDPDFDERFVVYARDDDRAERVLTEAIRYQLLRMNVIVDDLQLTDYSLFLFVENSMSRDDLKATLKKAIDLGERTYQSAEILGPRTPEKEAGHYEKATIEKALRTSGVGTAESRAGAE
jgi:hypothetical protein